MDQFGAIQSNFVALEKSAISPCPIGREGQPNCLFKNEIAKLNKIISNLLSQSPDTPRLKELQIITNQSSIDPLSNINKLLRAIEDCSDIYPTLAKDLDFIKQTIFAAQKIRTNISIGEWLDTEIISAILRQFQYNTEQAGLAQYRFGGCFRYDDFEVYDDKLINCGCLSPSPDIDHLKWNYIKQSPFTHFIFNTCSRISTGQHFVSLVFILSNGVAQLQYFDSQHIGPYHNGEIPPDFHTRNFNNPLCNRFKNYTSHFDDWFNNLAIEANKDNYKIKLIHNMKIYQHNNYACGIYSLFHGIGQALEQQSSSAVEKLGKGVAYRSNTEEQSSSAPVDAAMDRFIAMIADMSNSEQQSCSVAIEDQKREREKREIKFHFNQYFDIKTID